MDLAAKLQLKTGQSLELVSPPTSAPIALAEIPSISVGTPPSALLVFVRDRAELSTQAQTISDAAASDRVTWVAYPKSRQLGTDLNRDSLVEALGQIGIQPVRQIAIDEIWSALRFRSE